MNRTLFSLPVMALLALGALASSAPAALAAERVLGMNVEGDRLTKKDRDDLLKVVQAKLGRYPDLELLQPPAGELMDEMIDLECVDIDLSCLARLGRKYKADKVFYAQIDAGPAKGYVVHVKVVDAAGDKLVREGQMDVKGAAGLGAALEVEIEAAFGKPPEPVVKVTTGKVVVTANVAGAKIFVGAELVGTGSVELERPAGEVVVRVVHDGYLEQIVKVAVVAGETVERRVDLAMAGPVDPGPGKKKIDDGGDSDWILWAVVGAVVVGGTIAIIAATTGGEDESPRAPVVFSIDRNNAWRDQAVIGGGGRP